LNQRVGEILIMLGTYWRPVVDERGRPAAPNAAIRGNPVSRRYLSAASPITDEGPQRRWRLLLPRVRRAVDSWLRRAHQRRALARLDEQLLCDIGLEPCSEDGKCSIPFRLPRQF